MLIKSIQDQSEDLEEHLRVVFVPHEGSHVLWADIWLWLREVFCHELVKPWNAILQSKLLAKKFKVFLHPLPIRKVMDECFQDIWHDISVFVLSSITKGLINNFLNKSIYTRGTGFFLGILGFASCTCEEFEFPLAFCSELMICFYWVWKRGKLDRVAGNVGTTCGCGTRFVSCKLAKIGL